MLSIVTSFLIKIKDAPILTNIIQIVDTREKSSISGSAWTESLCLKKIDAKNYLLFVGGYEAIGEVSDFYDEEKDETTIPETIDGQRVQGEDGDIIVGESIIQNEDDGEVMFNDLNDKNLKSWLKSVSWDYEETLSSLKLAMGIKSV